LLTDTYESIAKQVRSAVTDSISGIAFDPAESTGTSNLHTILSVGTGEALGLENATLRAITAGGKDVVETVEEVLCAEFALLRQGKSFPAQVARNGRKSWRKEKTRGGSEAVTTHILGLGSS
jgi:hypothetical protein